MEEKIKIFIGPIICVVLFVLMICALYSPAVNLYTNAIDKNPKLTQQYNDLKQNLESLKNDKEREKNIQIEGSKVIYENPEFRFSKDASFAPLIEKFIDISKLSGVRIHSIDYNYAPADDPVFVAQYAGYNVCELSITAVGHYNNFQRLFETIVADMNIMNLAEINMAPWEADNSILVGKFKLRLYTKTM